MSLFSLQEVQVELGGRIVLDLPRLDLAAGEIVTVLGENGAGKSTLIHAAAGQLNLTRGKILFDGESLLRGAPPASKRARQKIGLVLQEPLLLGRDVERAVAFGLKARHLPRAELKRRVQGVLQRLALSHLAHRSERQLSGGERRQVAFAAALATAPQLLLLDEVTSGLDEQARQRVEAETIAQAQQGSAVILTTHQSDQAERLGHHVIRLAGGQLVKDGG